MMLCCSVTMGHRLNSCLKTSASKKRERKKCMTSVWYHLFCYIGCEDKNILQLGFVVPVASDQILLHFVKDVLVLVQCLHSSWLKNVYVSNVLQLGMAWATFSDWSVCCGSDGMSVCFSQCLPFLLFIPHFFFIKGFCFGTPIMRPAV